MYYFYMGSVLLPIPPEKLSLKVKNANKTMTLIDQGEVNFLRSAGLTDVEFEVLIPAVEYSFAKYDGGFKKPKYFTDHFEKLKTSKEPFQFIVTRKMPDGKLLFDTNMTVSMESYTTTEQANEGFDLKVSIKLKQYRSFGTKVVKVVSENKASVEPVRETTNSPAPKKEATYTVKSGDCLWNIAKKYYGDGSKYKLIYEANKDKVQNPNLIYPNQVLTIPSV
jgi:LysM repeat protein